MTRSFAGLFGGPAPRWFTVPAHRPFVEDLASGLHAALSPQGPEALADAVVLTPTRRAARALAEAFVGIGGGKPLLLPQILALGDLEQGEPPFEPGDLGLDLPPAIGAYRRRFELARLVADHAGLVGRDLDASAALELADALGDLINSAQIEEVEHLDGLSGLVTGELARHWVRSAEFLRIAAEAWPDRLAALGVIDVSQRRVRLLRALAERWATDPPPGVLIAAGSTGTAPATADLLAVIAAAPQGATVLPGLDLDLAEDAWEKVDEQHPQGAMKRLLDRGGTNRAAVRLWPTKESPAEQARGRSRRRLINEALRPAEATDDWIGQIARLRAESSDGDPVVEGLQGLSTAVVRHEEEAAALVALLLREALEIPGMTAALVTPDQALGRRVAARLSRWGVSADVSAGVSLLTFPVAVLAAATARLSARPVEPAGLLTVLKHPLLRLGWDRPRKTLERYGLRGPAPRDWDELLGRLDRSARDRIDNLKDDESREQAAASLRERFEEARALASELRDALEAAAAAFQGGAVRVAEAARAHVQVLEAIAGPDLWAGAEGESAAALFAALIEESDGLPPVSAAGYADLVERFLADATVRSGGASHPRLRILGAIEARLVRADRLVLAGLEEGVWPAGPPVDPFLSRPMRERLGLPPPERRVGLSAHDFAQAACAREVVLVHAERRGGQPAVKSRWLWRLETLAKAAKVELPVRADAAAWARALDRPDGFAPARRPEPKPPVAVRPRSLFVTQVERWVRDPYAIYARHILKLRRLQRPGEPFEAAARGSAIHKALEQFTLAWPEALPEDCATLLREHLVEALDLAGMGEIAMVRERVLAAECARWLAAFEARRRPGARLLVEQTGTYGFEAPGGRFTVSAKADRIEVRDGRADVLDFKTGQSPTEKQINAGFAPQLTLTAAILANGGFAGVETPPGDLGYVRVTGRKPPGEELIRVEAGDSKAAADKALAGLARLVDRFDQESEPYLSWTALQFIGRFGGDYDQLARLWEWFVLGDDEDESS